MTSRKFFRLSLVLPIALPLAFLPFGTNLVSALLLLSITFGGVQYILFAAWMYFAIGRRQCDEDIQRLSLLSPLLFAPVQAVGWLAYGYYEKLSNPALIGLWDGLLPFAIYTLLIGYFYVLLINGAFLVLRGLGIIKGVHQA